MISEPYLLNEDCTPFVEPVTDEPDLIFDEEFGIVKYLNTSDLPAKTLQEAQEKTQIKYVFWIMAGVQVGWIRGLVFIRVVVVVVVDDDDDVVVLSFSEISC